MPFRVDMSAKVAQEFNELKKLGSQIGVGREERKALYKIVERLRADPHGVGGLVEELFHLELQIRDGFVNPVEVRFAIHDEKRLVYIMKVAVPIS